MSNHWSSSMSNVTKLLIPCKRCSQNIGRLVIWSIMYKKKKTKIRKSEGEVGGQTMQPQSTHGILEGPSKPAFSLKLVGLASAITLLFSGTCASSQELSECLSLNFRGREVRSPSLVRPGAWNYRVCIHTPLCGTSVAYISSRVLLLCFLCVGMWCCLGSALSVLNVCAWKHVFCFAFQIWLLKLSIRNNQASVMADIFVL